MPYIPHTEADRQAMLTTIGASSIDELFREIPENLRLAPGSLDLPPALDEPRHRAPAAELSIVRVGREHQRPFDTCEHGASLGLDVLCAGRLGDGGRGRGRLGLDPRRRLLRHPGAQPDEPEQRPGHRILEEVRVEEAVDADLQHASLYRLGELAPSAELAIRGLGDQSRDDKPDPPLPIRFQQRSRNPGQGFVAIVEREGYGARGMQVAGARVLLELRGTGGSIPPGPQAGQIVSVYGNAVSFAAQNMVVSINRGKQHGLEPGHVLALLRESNVVTDTTDSARPAIRLPGERNGLMMVFRTFDRVSYAIVLDITDAARVGDRFVNP